MGAERGRGGGSGARGDRPPTARGLPPELAAMVPLVDGLAATLGRNCEVALHDFRDPQHSVVAIAGDLTGRRVGAPLTDRLLQAYRREGDAARDIIGVRTRTPDGRLLKSSTVFIRNRRGKIVGSLGINLDLGDIEAASQVLLDLCGRGAGTEGETINFATDVADMLDHMLESAIAQVGRPVQFFERAEKVAVVKMLDERGAFLIRGAVEEVARRLGISRFTVYSYLDETRAVPEAR